MRKLIWLLLVTTCLSCNKKAYEDIPPLARFTFKPSAGLTTDTISLDATETDPGSVGLSAYFRWDWNGDGIWDTEYEKTNTTSHRYYAPGIHNTILEVINSNGLTDTISHQVQLGQGYSAPHPKFEVYPSVGNFLTEFIFDASVSYDDEDSLDQLMFRWDWNGDGIWDTHNENIPLTRRKFDDVGFYNVILQAQDPGKLTSQVMKTVEVHNLNPDLIPNFTWTPEYGTTADTFLLDASSSFHRLDPFATLFYSWRLPPDFEWTDWDTCRTIQTRFGGERDYNLEMRVRDTNHLIAQTRKVITIYHENLPPNPVLVVGHNRGNIRTQFFFDSWNTRDLESLPTSLQVRWDFDGDGSFDTEYSKERTIYHQYPESGTYKVVLEVMDPEGLSDTTSQYVIISPYANETGLIRDHRDHRMYGSVKIGEQWWMSENLKFSPPDHNKDYILMRRYRRFDFDPVNWSEIVGGLYNIYHATRNDFYGDVAGICPKGWHIPSKAEWEEMIDYIGGYNQADKLLIGGEMDFNAKFAGWGKLSSDPDALFSIAYQGLGKITYWWSFQRLPGWPVAQSCWNATLIKGESRIYTGYSGNDLFYSVRCVKDEE